MDIVKKTHRFRVVGVVPDPDGWDGGFRSALPTLRILPDIETIYFVKDHKVVPYVVESNLTEGGPAM